MLVILFYWFTVFTLLKLNLLEKMIDHRPRLFLLGVE